MRLNRFPPPPPPEFVDRHSTAKWTFPTINTPGASQVLQAYSYVDPKHLVPTNLLQNGILFFGFNKNLIRNQNYLTIIDFTKSSVKARFYLINIKSGAVSTYHVAHGIGSDPHNSGYATRFSNTSGSYQTSLGFYLTGSSFVWSGHGHGVNLDGLSPTNSNAADRGIYFHGSTYVHDSNVKQGMSEGCFATSLDTDANLYPLIDNGGIIYADLSGQKVIFRSGEPWNSPDSGGEPIALIELRKHSNECRRPSQQCEGRTHRGYPA